jgi:hypothetical protein
MPAVACIRWTLSDECLVRLVDMQLQLSKSVVRSVPSRRACASSGLLATWVSALGRSVAPFRWAGHAPSRLALPDYSELDGEGRPAVVNHPHRSESARAPAAAAIVRLRWIEDLLEFFRRLTACRFPASTPQPRRGQPQQPQQPSPTRTPGAGVGRASS